MRRLLSLLVLICMFSFCETYAQKQNTQETIEFQELTKKQQRKVKKEIRKKVQEHADEQAFSKAVAALKDKKWILKANTLYTKGGKSIEVPEDLNFVLFEGETVYVQLTSDTGQKGITVEGKTFQIESKTDKKGNITYSFYVIGVALKTRIIVNISHGSNYAYATATSILSHTKLTFSGKLTPVSNSDAFKRSSRY